LDVLLLAPDTPVTAGFNEWRNFVVRGVAECGFAPAPVRYEVGSQSGTTYFLWVHSCIPGNSFTLRVVPTSRPRVADPGGADISSPAPISRSAQTFNTSSSWWVDLPQ
jgi:hypothetical protein